MFWLEQTQKKQRPNSPFLLYLETRVNINKSNNNNKKSKPRQLICVSRFWPTEQMDRVGLPRLPFRSRFVPLDEDVRGSRLWVPPRHRAGLASAVPAPGGRRHSAVQLPAICRQARALCDRLWGDLRGNFAAAEYFSRWGSRALGRNDVSFTVTIELFHSQEWQISNFARSLNRNIASHSMKNFGFSWLTQMNDNYTTNSHCITYIWENLLFELGSERVYRLGI